MTHSTTTFARIVALSEAEQRLLSKEYLTDAERQQFRDIRASLAKLWPQRRAELVFAVSGPPRLISAPDPRDHRKIAYGIAPLPSGGAYD